MIYIYVPLLWKYTFTILWFHVISNNSILNSQITFKRHVTDYDLKRKWEHTLLILNSWKYAKSQGCLDWHEPFVDILSMTFLSSYTCKASMHDIAQVIVPPPTKEKHYRRYLHCLQNDIKIMLLFLIFWFSCTHEIKSNRNLWIFRICQYFMQEYIQNYEHTIAQYNNVTLWIWNPVH